MATWAEGKLCLKLIKSEKGEQSEGLSQKVTEFCDGSGFAFAFDDAGVHFKHQKTLRSIVSCDNFRIARSSLLFLQ